MFTGSLLFDTIYRMSTKRGSCLVAVCTVWTVLCWCLLYGCMLVGCEPNCLKTMQMQCDV